MRAAVKIAIDRLKARADQSRKFVCDYLKLDNFIEDEPRSRNLHMLLSFSFELVLKTKIAILNNDKHEDELNKYLSGLGHNLEKISKEISKTELNKLGINSVQQKMTSCNPSGGLGKKYKYYQITTVSNDLIKMEDFTDIRYGCLSSGTGLQGTAKQTEFNKTIKFLEGISDKINLKN
ncbi:MAG: hypothetical protein ABH830_02055 [Patescibacteria group bacterium]